MKRLLFALLLLSACSQSAARKFGYTPLPATGQDPSNVSITGGTIANVTLSNVTDGTWASKQKAFCLAKVSNLTGFHWQRLGWNPNGATSGTVTNDALVPGGGLASTGAAPFQTGTSWLQQPKTTNWCIAVRASLHVPASGHNGGFEIINSTAAHDVFMGTTFAVSTTNFVITIDGASSTTVAGSITADANWHDFVMTMVSGTLTQYVDQVQNATTSTLTNLSDENMYPAVFAQVTGDTRVTWEALMFLDP